MVKAKIYRLQGANGYVIMRGPTMIGRIMMREDVTPAAWDVFIPAESKDPIDEGPFTSGTAAKGFAAGWCLGWDARDATPDEAAERQTEQQDEAAEEEARKAAELAAARGLEDQTGAEFERQPGGPAAAEPVTPKPSRRGAGRG